MASGVSGLSGRGDASPVGVWVGTAGTMALVEGVGLSSGVGLGSAIGLDRIVPTMRCVHTAGLALPVAANAVNARIPATPDARASLVNRSGLNARVDGLAYRGVA